MAGFSISGNYYIGLASGRLASGRRFFLIGFGNGPLFLNFNYLIPIIFGEEASPCIMGIQMAVSSLSSMTTPILCGFLGQQIGMWIFPLYLLIFFIGMTATGLRVNKMFWSMKQYRFYIGDNRRQAT